MTKLRIKHNVNFIILFLILPFFVTLIVSTVFNEPTITPKLFYFYFSVGLLLIIVSAKYLFKRYANNFIQYNRIDLILILFTIYQYIRLSFTPNIHIYNNSYIIYLLLIGFYFIFKHQTYKNHSNLNKAFKPFIYILIIISLITAIWGILQFAGIIRSYNDAFKITGPFGNPGPYANYLASVLPLILSVGLYGKDLNILNRLSIILVCLFIITALVITFARTAWIASIAGIILVVLYSFKIKSLFRILFGTVFKKMILILLIIILLITSGYFLLKLKKDSVTGRLFIWNICIEMIKDKPFFGHGYNAYNVVHNNYQANYFRNHPDDIKNAMLADNIEFAFNDYLQMTIESGVIGLCIFLLIIFFAFKPSNKYSDSPGNLLIGAKASLAAILITALFSYPFYNVPVQLNFFLYLGIISGYSTQKQIKINLNRNTINPFFLIIIITIIVFEFHQLKRFSAHKTWNEAAMLAHKGKLETAMKMYKRLYPILRYDHFFLFNYGAELSLIEEYNKSISILNKTLKTLNDADVYTYLGNSYEGAGNLKNAEICFEQAMFLIPHRFYPKYRLVKLYAKSGKMNEALNMAEKIINMPIKVDSQLVRQIKKEMEHFIKTYKYK